MLELEDIEILPESMPPAHTESAATWMIVVAVAIVLVIAALIAKALSSKRKESADKNSPLESARNEFLKISNSLNNPSAAESFPTLIHAWANAQLEQCEALPSQLVDELIRTRDRLTPHCYQPATRWRDEIDPDSTLTSLATSLGIDITNSQKGGHPSDA